MVVKKLVYHYLNGKFDRVFNSLSFVPVFGQIYSLYPTLIQILINRSLFRFAIGLPGSSDVNGRIPGDLLLNFIFGVDYVIYKDSHIMTII